MSGSIELIVKIFPSISHIILEVEMRGQKQVLVALATQLGQGSVEAPELLMAI